jgi:serine phosphatase RsbU (regulator of sigma subunit)/MFS family permease
MLESILNALLPGQPSLAVRRAWTAGLLLFPVALATGFLLLVRNVSPPVVPVAINSTGAIRIARDFLISQGIDAGGWSASCKSAANDNLLSFINENPDRNRLWQIAPPVVADVKLRSPGRRETASVSVSVDGKVLGFSWTPEKPPGGSLPDAALADLATARVPAGFGFGKPSPDITKGKHIYTFRSSAVPDAALTDTVTIQGDRVTSVEIKAQPDDTDTDRGEGWQVGLTIVGSLFVCVVSLFSIYRYASRMQQQEVSHSRSLIVALLCAGFAMFVALNAVVNSNTGPVPLALILLVFAVMGIVCGALLAAAYGSGEGDIREAYPGKLTSLDALLTGRIFCRNTGISILFGMVCAGWLVLALGLLDTPFRIARPQGSVAISGSFARLAGVMPFVMYPLLSLSFAAAGLLQPLAFMQRYVKRARRWHMPVLLFCAGLVSTLRTHSRSNGDFLITSAILVAALLLPFFLLDLLSTMVCLTMVTSTMGLAISLAVAPSLTVTSVQVHIAVAAGVTGFALFCLARGPSVTEQQVRPLYARHIAERQALEAEVSAAREAQLRLLPESVPDFAALDISAACVPAETVGGDFYDFFPLGDGRLGVFIAEGNNRGLAAALTIALAKGYLMQCVERFREPVEILTRLESMLSSIFTPDPTAGRSSLTDFAFASIDTVAGEIRYARTGAYPKVVVVSTNAVVASERLVPVSGRQSPISEGRARLTSGDHVILFTDGIGRRLALGNRRPEDAAAALLSRTKGQISGEVATADQIGQRFFAATKGSLEPDDLTLVVIQIKAVGQLESTAALRVVA